MTPRVLLLTTGLGIPWVGHAQNPARTEPTPPRPNIVIILADDLGYGDLGCYGSAINETPNIDLLAREGMRFTDFYVSDSVCSPSRAALLTGCYAERVGMDVLVNQPGGERGLSPQEITLAEMLRTTGYATAAFGKWHQGDQYEFLPCNQGFDTFLGLPYSHDIAPSFAEAGWPPESGSLDAERDGKILSTGWAIPPLPVIRDFEVIEQAPDPTTLTDRWTNAAVAFMRGHHDQPFFVYLAHTDVHLPFFPSANDRAASRNGLFGAALRRLDRSVGRIMSTLQELGIDQNTLVLFLSDNGTNSLNPGQSNAPLRGAKATSWEGGHRVPFIGRWPGHISANTINDKLSASMDIFPTLAQLSGGRVPADRKIDGHDLGSLLFANPNAEPPRQTYYFYSRGNFRAVRWKQWKYYPNAHREKVAMEGETYQSFAAALYDLAHDAAESTDVSLQHPDVVTHLQKLVAAAIADLGDRATHTVGAGVRPAGIAIPPTPLDRLGPIEAKR